MTTQIPDERRDAEDAEIRGVKAKIGRHQLEESK